MAGVAKPKIERSGVTALVSADAAPAPLALFARDAERVARCRRSRPVTVARVAGALTVTGVCAEPPTYGVTV